MLLLSRYRDPDRAGTIREIYFDDVSCPPYPESPMKIMYLIDDRL